MDLNVAIQELKDRFDENYPNLNMEHIDREKIVVRFNTYKIAVFFDKSDYYYIDHEATTSNNKKIKIFKDKGFQFDTYFEVLIHYSAANYELCAEANVSHCESFDLTCFCIGNNKIEIGHPSDMFKLLFKDYESDDLYADWNYYITIKIYASDKSKIQHLIQQAFFLVYQICPSIYAKDYPEIACLIYEDSDGWISDLEDIETRQVFENEYSNLCFDESKFSEPIYFFNAAKRINDPDISFFYFYKVLEFFFLITQKDLIKKVIDQYYSDSDIENCIYALHNNYLGQQEITLLNQLIATSFLKELIDQIIDKAFSKSLIGDKSIDSFCVALYEHRNSIVHGKFEYKRLELTLPNMILDDVNIFWVEIIEDLAYFLIKKMCYGK